MDAWASFIGQTSAMTRRCAGGAAVASWPKRGWASPSAWGWMLRNDCSLLAPGGEAPHFITVERRWERVDGGALVAMVAHTGDPDLPSCTGTIPSARQKQGHGLQWHDDEIGVAGCLLSLVDAVRNGGEPTLWSPTSAARSRDHRRHPRIFQSRRCADSAAA